MPSVATRNACYEERTPAAAVVAAAVFSVLSLRHPRDFKSITLPEGKAVPGPAIYMFMCSSAVLQGLNMLIVSRRPIFLDASRPVLASIHF